VFPKSLNDRLKSDSAIWNDFCFYYFDDMFRVHVFYYVGEGQDKLDKRALAFMAVLPGLNIRGIGLSFVVMTGLS
jgi:hypothetical protein